MNNAWKVLLRQQMGLITSAQARALGLPSTTLHRRTRGERATWQVVLPRVYATFAHSLTDDQHAVAAVLYGGDGAALTGAAALHWRKLPYLPHEVKARPVDIVVPVGRECTSTKFVRVARTRRGGEIVQVNQLACATVARAVGDCARKQGSYETVLAVVAAALNAGPATLAELVAELAAGPTRGSRLLRRVLMAAERNVRSVPEAELLQLLDGTGLPAPLVNEPLLVGSRRLVPDFRWGRLIVEVDSRLHHLLTPGAWEATQRRRALLRQAGYHVLPVTPEMIRDDPAEVLALIIAAYAEYAAA